MIAGASERIQAARKAVTGTMNGAGLSMLRQRTSALPSAGIAGAIVLLGIAFSLTTNTFLRTDNLLEVARQSSLLGLMSIGVTYVLISGEIDLSVGSVYALAGVVAAIVVSATNSAVIGVLAGLGVGIAAGSANALLAAYLGLPSFIVTLGTLQIMRGLALSITDGIPKSLFESHASGLGTLFSVGRGDVLGIPTQFVVLLGIAAIATVVLRMTPFGLRIYAAGGSKEAAALAGANVARLKLSTYLISGTLAALAGVIALGFLGSASPLAADGIEFDVFAAAVLGGASLFGGLGTATGAVLGALFLGVLRNGLLLLNVSSFTQTIIIGAITIAAVGLNRLALGRSGAI
jgi:ribose transport system permease protein